MVLLVANPQPIALYESERNGSFTANAMMDGTMCCWTQEKINQRWSGNGAPNIVAAALARQAV